MRRWWLGLSVISARKEREIINYISSAAPTCWFLLLLRGSYISNLFLFFSVFLYPKKNSFQKREKKYYFDYIQWWSLKCSHSRTHVRVPKQFIDPLSVNFNLKISNEIKCESFVCGLKFWFEIRGIDRVIIIF